MVFDVYLLREHGWVRPRFRAAFFPAIRAQLLVRQEHDPTLHRHTLVARLLDPVSGAPIDAVRPLIDVSIVRIETDYMTLSGFERIPDELVTRERDYAQSWLLEPVGHQGAQVDEGQLR